MASNPQLDREQWNRQLLQRTRDLTVEDAVEQCAGLYATAPTSYLSCAARIPGFRKKDLDRALYADRALVRIAALRGSGFLIPRDRIDMVVSARDRKEWYEGSVDKIVGEAVRKRWTRKILDLLDGQILPAREIRSHLGLSGKESEALRYLLTSLSQQRILAAASGPGSWRDNQYGYALWDQWFPESPPRSIDPSDARAALARWYLGGHGPASVDDFSWWSGLKKSNARAALDVSADHEANGLYDIGGAASDEPPAGVRLLPIWDTAVVTQKSRRRMVAEDHHRFVYDASGNATSTVVAEGRVIGVWDRGKSADVLRLRVAFFSGPGPSKSVEDEAEVLAGALGVGDVSVDFVGDPVDLTTASRNRFMSPLSGD